MTEDHEEVKVNNEFMREKKLTAEELERKRKQAKQMN